MKRRVAAALALLALTGCHRRHGPDGPTLTGALTADEAFYAYLSTSPSERGVLIAHGDRAGTAVAVTPTPLIPGQGYFLHMVAINLGGRGGVIGEFRLNGDGFRFADGGRRLLTGLPAWSAGYGGGASNLAPPAWGSPGGGVFPQGANGAAPWGAVKGIAPAAQWIWPADARSAPTGPPNACTRCAADFSAVILPG